MTKISKDSITYKVLEAFSHYLEYQRERGRKAFRGISHDKGRNG